MWFIAPVASWALSDPIARMQTSPNGKWIAFSTSVGDLYIAEAATPDEMFHASSRLGDGFAWSPDSERFAFVETLANSPPSLRILPAGEREPLTLISDPQKWIGQVRWLDADRIAYQSDEGGDHVTLWSVDIHDGASGSLLLDPGTDVSNVWCSPRGGKVVYATVDQRRPVLWRHDPGAQATQVADDLPPTPIRDAAVAFHPSGAELYYIAGGGPNQTAKRVSLFPIKTLSSIELSRRSQSLSVLDNNEAFLEMEGRIAWWRPSKRFGSKFEDGFTWRGLPLTLPHSLGERGFTGVVAGGVVVTAASLKKVGDGRLFSRDFMDIIQLSIDLARAGRVEEAIKWSDTMLKNEGRASSRLFRLHAARAWLERARGADSAADKWLRRALDSLPGRSADDEGDPEDLSRLVWDERILLEFFGEGDDSRARRAPAIAPASALQDPLFRWVNDLSQSATPEELALWRRAGGALRRGKWADCGAALQQMAARPAGSRFLREGLALLLDGSFDPGEKLLPKPEPDLPFLTADANFQRALLAVSDKGLSERFGKRELRETLMVQWVLTGQLDPARSLARIDLTDPEGPQINYLQILQRYLTTEEEEPWITRAVGEALLEPSVEALLEPSLRDARGHLTLQLCRAKLALITNDLPALDAALMRTEGEIESIPAAFWNSTGGDLLFTAWAFRAKYHERRREWDKALAAYDAAQGALERFPGDWGTLPLDLRLARTLVESGRANPDALQSLLQTIRGAGDPLVNPTHQADPLQVGLANLDAVGSRAPAWMLPYVAYTRGSFYSALGQNYRALDQLRFARRGEIPEGLLSRLLLEEASVRKALGQNRLAAQLLKRLTETPLTETPLTPPALALVIRELAQAEAACGLVPSQEDRMRELAQSLTLPPRWTLTMLEVPDTPQAAGEARH